MQDSPVIQWGKNFSNKFDLKDHKKILDIGCRQGYLSAYLAKRYLQQHFIAIDNLQEEIEHAKQYHLTNLSFERKDALSLDCADYFDAVISFSCLHWIKNKSKVLQNIYQSLKPAGKAYLQFFASHGRPKNDRFLYQTASSHQWKHYFKRFTPDYTETSLTEFSSLLQSEGFIIHRMEIVKYQTVFDHPELLHHWFKSWASHKKRIPLRKQDHFLQETVQSYLDFHNHSPQKAFPFYEYLLEVICEKPSLPLTSPTPIYQYGHIHFTSREAYVLKHYLQGKTAKEIASLSLISAKAIEFHIGNVKEKLNCYRRSEIYQAALSQGFINLIFDPKL
jgi:trans-aconitate methyltransferase/DNA-binding CsgD family transcriptional regulator